MRSKLPLAVASASVAALLALTVAAAPAHAPPASRVASGISPKLQSIGPLAMGRGGILYAADPQARRSLRSISRSRRPARRARRTSRSSTRRSPRRSVPRRVRSPIVDLKVDPQELQLVPRGDARPGRRCRAGAAPRRRRRQDRRHLARRGRVHRALRCRTRRTRTRRAAAATAASRSRTWRSAAAACSSPACRTRSSRRSSGRSRIRSSSADRGTSVEIFHGNHGQLETRSPVYTFIPYTVNGEAEPHRGLPVHAAREVPGLVAHAGREGARHDDRRARRRQPADRHGAVQEGRQGVSAHVEHQPRRDEDPDRRTSARRTRSRRRCRGRRASRTKRSNR